MLLFTQNLVARGMKPRLRRASFDSRSSLRAGEITVGLALLIAALAVGGFVALKPMFSRDKARARESAEATEQLVAATDAQAASAAASVAKIGEANTVAPQSPSRDFISREVPMALAKLPAPDPQALLEAERRRAAVMEGRYEEANRLYEKESKRAERLQQERDTALAERRAADTALIEAAAAKSGAERQRLIFIAVAVLAAGLWVFSYLSRVSPKSIGAMAADIRAGAKPIAALDAHTAPWLHGLINKHSRLSTPPADE